MCHCAFRLIFAEVSRAIVILKDRFKTRDNHQGLTDTRKFPRLLVPFRVDVLTPDEIRLIRELGPIWGPALALVFVFVAWLRHRWNRGMRGAKLFADKRVGIALICGLILLAGWEYYHFRFWGLPAPFRAGEVGILIAEAPGDQNLERQTAYQAAIMQLIQTTPELKDIVKVRLLGRLLPSDLEQQHAAAVKLGRWLHATFVLRPNALADIEEPWITIVDQPTFSNSDASMGTFSVSELAQPDKLRLPRDVLQLAQCTLVVSLYQRGSYEEASRELETVLASPELPKAAPTRADLNLTYGNALQATGHVGEAENAYRETIRLNPKSAEAHSNLGWALIKDGSYEESASEARQAIEIKPDLADAHITLGAALLRMRKFDDAIAEYRLAIGYSPNSADAHNNLGNALNAKGLRNEASSEIRYAIYLNPNSAESHVNLCNVLGDMGQYDKAIANCRKALELRPNLAEAYVDLGNLLSKKADAGDKSYDEAIVEFRQAIKLSPNMGYAHYGLGLALGLKGEALNLTGAYYDESISEFKHAIQLEPNDADYHRNLATSLDREARTDEGIAEYKKAIAINPNYAEAHYNLGNDLMQKHRYKEASREFGLAVTLNSKSFDAYFQLCKSLVAAREHAQAAAACEIARKLNSRPRPFVPTVPRFNTLASPVT